jgi:hypothetical protein
MRLPKAKKKSRAQRATRKQYVPVKIQRLIFILALLVALSLVVFLEVVRPNQDARSYTHRLDVASKPLAKCFDNLADTTGLKVFYAPDVSYADKAANTATILRQISDCRDEIKTFDQASHQLLVLRFAGYTQTYREAIVNQRQAFDVIGQSNDVLEQYQAMATFLSDYYKHIDSFRSYTSQLGGIHYFGTAELKKLSDEADDLRARSVKLQQLSAPAEFEPTKNTTSTMFAKAADGLDQIVDGYTYGNDYMATNGFASVDQAVSDYDSNVMNLPFDQLTNSYIPKQVMQLPDKVKNLLATSSE